MYSAEWIPGPGSYGLYQSQCTCRSMSNKKLQHGNDKHISDQGLGQYDNVMLLLPSPK